MSDKAFSSIDAVGRCLVDKKRTDCFRKAIKDNIEIDDIAFDIGTGSGILALFAAKFGAKKVYAVEYDPYIASVAMRNFVSNGFKDKIKLIIGDARKINYHQAEKANLIIMEMLTAGMIDEFQVQAINNLHRKKIISSKTKFIPYKQKTCITLTSANFNMYGFEMFSVYHLWKSSHDVPIPIEMTDRKVLNSICFDKLNNEIFDKNMSFKAKKDGEINSVFLQSQTFLSKNISIHNTEAINAPVLIPIRKMVVRKGDNVKIKISYGFGQGYKSFLARLAK